MTRVTRPHPALLLAADDTLAAVGASASDEAMPPPGLYGAVHGGGGMMEQGRLFVDSSGVEWEVYDESQWTIAWAIDWEYPPQKDNPGLLFDSVMGRRRVFPCPPDWQSLTDVELEELLKRATALH